MRRMMPRSRILPKIFAVGAVLIMAAACSGIDTQKPADPRTVNPTDVRKQSSGKLFGDDTFVFGGNQRPQDASEGGSGLGVNSFLWRASLDTVVFMPVNSADPFGGVIITDWHTPPESPPGERFKLNIYILGRVLRADGVRVAVFRQVKDGADWQDALVGTEVGTKIEDAILMKARQLRYETLNQ